MARPLYRLLEGVVLAPDSGHRGLWYDKFCDTWSDDWHLRTVGETNPKLKWITRASGDVGSAQDLRDYAERFANLVDARGGEYLIAASESRFVTGLGLSHPVENGFAWHPTLGTPYLPGSSVKGLTKSWAQGEQQCPEDVARIFGLAGQIGTVVFLDAVPVQPVRVEPDVLTPTMRIGVTTTFPVTGGLPFPCHSWSPHLGWRCSSGLCRSARRTGRT